jgi:hypothetical protein
MSVVITFLVAVLLFVIAVILLSLKLLAGNRTPLKEHACDVMCRHGRGHPCTCKADGTCSDYPEGRGSKEIPY